MKYLIEYEAQDRYAPFKKAIRHGSNAAEVGEAWSLEKPFGKPRRWGMAGLSSDFYDADTRGDKWAEFYGDGGDDSGDNRHVMSVTLID